MKHTENKKRLYCVECKKYVNNLQRNPKLNINVWLCKDCFKLAKDTNKENEK